MIEKASKAVPPSGLRGLQRRQRPRPCHAGYKFRFIRLSPSLVAFGIREQDSIVYSDPEKTLLDFVYLWRYNSVATENIIADILEWTKGISMERLRTYARKYPRTVGTIVERIECEG